MFSQDEERGDGMWVGGLGGWGLYALQTGVKFKEFWVGIGVLNLSL